MRRLRPRGLAGVVLAGLVVVASLGSAPLSASPNPALGGAGSPSELQSRFAPEVWAAVEAGQPARVLVRFRQRADLSAAAGVERPVERVGAVQRSLAATARASQRPELAPQVVNHSWGVPREFPELCQAVLAHVRAGIMPVFAAGNFGPLCESITFPGAYDEVLSVGSMAEHQPDVIAFFSGRGPSPGGDRRKTVAPDVVAPGEFIWSAFNDGTYIQMIGTSQSTPMVSGLVALMWSANRRLVGEIALTKTLLQSTTQKVKGVGRECDSRREHPNNIFGWGIVDAVRAVQQALKPRLRRR